MTPQFPGSIGWLGTGRMGAAMAGRLIDAGRPVPVWNRTAAKTQPLAERGATVADSIGGLASCDLVFVMGSSSADLEQVTLGAGGVLNRQRRAGRPGGRFPGVEGGAIPIPAGRAGAWNR